MPACVPTIFTSTCGNATDMRSWSYALHMMNTAQLDAHALDRARLLGLDASHHRWLELLAEAGRIFSAPIDVRLTCMQLCRLLVGRFQANGRSERETSDPHVREP